jgi:hypothetical protein
MTQLQNICQIEVSSDAEGGTVGSGEEEPSTWRASAGMCEKNCDMMPIPPQLAEAKLERNLV